MKDEPLIPGARLLKFEMSQAECLGESSEPGASGQPQAGGPIEPQIAELKALVSAVSKERETILDTKNQLSAKLAAREAELKEAAAKLAGLIAECHEAEQARQGLQTELELARTQLIKQRTDAQKYFETLGAEQEAFRREGKKVKEKISVLERAASLAKVEREAAESGREGLAKRLADLQAEADRLRQESDAGSKRNLALAAELEEAKALHQELNDALAEAPRLVNWLQRAIQNRKPQASAKKSASIDTPPATGDPLAEALARMRDALDLSRHSFLEAISELSSAAEMMNLSAQSLPERRAVHRLAAIFASFLSELRAAPRPESSSLLAIRRAVDMLAQLLKENNPPLPSASAIVVAREIVSVETVIAAMKSIDFRLFCAEESRPALETLAAEHHDLILLEWQGSASIQDAHRIRTMPRHQRTPIIFLADAEHEITARSAGDEVLIKPLVATEVALTALTFAFKVQLSNPDSGSILTFS